MADNFSEGPRNGRKFSRPIGYFVRPAEPGGFVRFPFGGHAKAESAGRFDLRWRLHSEKEFNTEITEDTERTEKRKNSKSRELTEKGTLFVTEPAVEDGLIGVDAAVAEEGPIAAGFFAFGGVAFDDENFFLIVRSFSNDLPEGVGDERVAPEFQAGVAILGFAFEADAIDDRGVNAIGNGVAALNGFPRVELCGAELRFLVRMPADAGGIENYIGAAQSGEARAFGIPLIPADLHADACVPGIKIRKTEIAGREIKFFIVERIVGNVHFAVFSEERSVGVEQRAGIVINAGSAALEERNDQRDFLLFCDLRELFRGRSGDRFRKIEKVGVFRAAKIFAVKQFVERDDLRAARSGFTDFLDGARQVFFRVRRAFHLHEPDGKFAGHEIQFSMSWKENICTRFVVSFALRL